MEDIKKAQQRLVNAIVAMHPQLCMGDEKQEELYLAMHDLTSKMAKLNECGGECSNENSGLHLQRVMQSALPDTPDDEIYDAAAELYKAGKMLNATLLVKRHTTMNPAQAKQYCDAHFA